MADLTEVAVPTRFLFLSLGPRDSNTIFEYDEMGRAMAALFSDKVCDWRDPTGSLYHTYTYTSHLTL